MREAITATPSVTGGNRINIAYIERLKSTFRARLFPLVRRTRCLAPKVGILDANMWLVRCCHTFCWTLENLRRGAEEGTDRK